MAFRNRADLRRPTPPLPRSGLLEEAVEAQTKRNQPAKRRHLASAAPHVIDIVIDAEQCRVVSADGPAR